MLISIFVLKKSLIEFDYSYKKCILLINAKHFFYKKLFIAGSVKNYLLPILLKNLLW